MQNTDGATRRWWWVSRNHKNNKNKNLVMVSLLVELRQAKDESRRVGTEEEGYEVMKNKGRCIKGGLGV